MLTGCALAGRAFRRSAARLPTVVALISVAVLLPGGCKVQRSGERPAIPGHDGGGKLDDARVPTDAQDAGERLPCSRYAWPRPVARLDGRAPREGFRAEGTTTDRVIVDDEGVLRLPVQHFRYGALYMTGYEEAALSREADPSFADLGGASATGSTLARVMERNFPGDTLAPEGLRIEDGNRYSVLAEGEIRLEAGAHRLALDADDRGLLEVTVGGESHAAVAASLDSPGEVRFEVPAEGWYPLRFAYSDYGGPSRFSLRHAPGDGPLRVVAAQLLRTDVSERPGRELLGWNGREPVGLPTGARIDDTETSVELGGGRPDGLGLGSDDDWSVRWVGRMRLGAPLEPLAVDSDDGHRVWVDGVFVGGEYDGPREDSYALRLTPGWVDTVVELTDRGGDAYAHVRSGGAPVPSSALRPYARFGGIPFGRGTDEEIVIGPGEEQEARVSLSAPAERPVAVEVSAVVDSMQPQRLTGSVAAPWGTTFEMWTHRRGAAGRARGWHRRTLSAEDIPAGVSAAGEWRISFRNDGEREAAVRSAGVLAHMSGVPAPYPERGQWVSAPIDLSSTHRVSGLQTDAVTPEGARMRLAIRVAPTERGLADAPWEPLAAERLERPIEARYVQVRAVLEGGTDTPRLERVRVVGSPCLCDAGPGESSCDVERSDATAVVLYRFDEGEGATVADRGRGEPLDLAVPDPDAVAWHDDALELVEPTRIEAETAQKLFDALTESEALTIEAWLQPSWLDLPQPEPGRIVTYSKDNDDRNFTLAQTSDGSYQARLHVGEDGDGRPFLETARRSVRTDLTHVVYTWSAEEGTSRLFIDGEQAQAERNAGDLASWDDGWGFALGDELDGSRAWLGTLHLVAVHDVALPADVVRHHFDLGPGGDGAR